MAEMDNAQVEERMWKAVSDDRIGMLGLTGPDAGHFQPMSSYHEQETQVVDDQGVAEFSHAYHPAAGKR